MDPGGFGAVTITKSITLDGGGYHAGILNAATSGVIVNAPGGDVVLRDLAITGVSGCGSSSGVRGVYLFNARSLRIEDTTISGNNIAGIGLAPTAADTKVLIDGVAIGETCQTGIDAAPPAGGTVDVMVRDSTVSNSLTGVRAAAGAHVWLTGSTIFGNGTGLLTTGGGLIDGLGDNQVVGNGVDGVFSNVLVAQPLPIDTPAPTPVKPAAVKPKPKCRVPKLVGLKPAAARTRLKAAGCALGKVTRKATRKPKQNGRITAQRAKAGARLAAGAKVAVTVGRLVRR